MQFTSEGYEAIREANLAMVGERDAEVLAKACDAPDSLSAADARVMEAIAYNHVLSITKRLALYQAAGFYDEDSSNQWSRYANATLGSIFSTQFGRSWWKTTKHFWDPEISAIGDE